MSLHKLLREYTKPFVTFAHSIALTNKTLEITSIPRKYTLAISATGQSYVDSTFSIFTTRGKHKYTLDINMDCYKSSQSTIVFKHNIYSIWCTFDQKTNTLAMSVSYNHTEATKIIKDVCKHVCNINVPHINYIPNGKTHDNHKLDDIVLTEGTRGQIIEFIKTCGGQNIPIEFDFLVEILSQHGHTHLSQTLSKLELFLPLLKR